MLPSTRDGLDLPPGLLPPQLPLVLCGQGSQGAWGSTSQTHHYGWVPSSRLQLSGSNSSTSSSSGRSKGSTTAYRRPVTASGRAPGSSNSHRARAAPATGLRIGYRRAAAFIAGIGVGGGVGCGPSEACSLRLWPFHRNSNSGSSSSGRRKRMLIMMSNTGGGHRASAEAIKQAVEEQYGDKYEVLVVDMWADHTPAPFNKLPDSYSFLVKHPLLWRSTYTMLQPRLCHYPYFAGVHAIVSRQLHAAFDYYDPDLVVSVHPLMQHVPVKILADRAKRLQRGAPVPFATVVTDFTTCHNTWFYPGVTKCFVPTEFCRDLGLRMGLDPEQLVVHGLPIRPVFSKKLPARKALRHRLGMAQDLPAVLLVGGGEGMGALEATVEQLDVALQGTAQVVVICGRNRALLQRLQARVWPGATRVLAVGFVDNIHEWMGAVDAIITKAGPGTIAEALISGLPILLNGNIPCQEEGNIPYVVDNHVGAFETNPTRISAIIADWFGPQRQQLTDMARRSKALGRPQAVYQIAEDLCKLLDERLEQTRLQVAPLQQQQQPKQRLAAAA